MTQLSKIESIHIGRAGESRVCAEMILHGLTPYLPLVDSGIDIIVGESGKRVQVKSSSKPSYSKKDYSWRYSFSIRQLQFRKGEGGLYKRYHTRKSYDQVDYFVFCLLEHNQFYVIPESEIGEKVSFCINTPDEIRTYKRNPDFVSKSKYEKYRNAWHLLGIYATD